MTFSPPLRSYVRRRARWLADRICLLLQSCRANAATEPNGLARALVGAGACLPPARKRECIGERRVLAAADGDEWRIPFALGKAAQHGAGTRQPLKGDRCKPVPGAPPAAHKSGAAGGN